MRHELEADRAAAFLTDLAARDQDGSFLATSIIYVVSGGRRLTEPSRVTISRARAPIQAVLRPHTMT
jgi:hypothetical protein